jgi:hypothetical protein
MKNLWCCGYTVLRYGEVIQRPNIKRGHDKTIKMNFKENLIIRDSQEE